MFKVRTIEYVVVESISKKIFCLLLHSANGLNNAVVFNGIEEESIECTENFISTNLLSILKGVAERNGRKMDMKDMMLFFGINFASNPSNFKFTIGEKILIKQIKQHIGNKGFKHFAFKKRNCDMPKLTKTAVGVIFGESETSDGSQDDEFHAKSANPKKSISSSENCDTKLLISANKVTNNELRAIGDTTNSILTADMVEIERSENGSIKGYVQCAFCKEMKKYIINIVRIVESCQI